MTHAECFQKLDNTLALLEERRPDFIKLARPRRVLPPFGFHNPKYYPVSLYSNAMMTVLSPEDKTATVGYTVQRKLLDYGVPTYFVKEDLLNDLVLTEPPKDLQLNDQLKWPMPAMTLMIPKAFAKRYFGAEVLNITIVRFEPDEELPSRFVTETGPAEKILVPGPYPRFAFHSEVLDRTGLLSAYGQSQPMKGQTIGELLADEVLYYGHFIDSLSKPEPDFFDPEKDGEITSKLISVALKVLMVMAARPNLITEGVCQRVAKMKKGVEREALWQPNYIGATYVSRVKAAHQGGTHESPRIHWRRGHMRNQAYGPGRVDHKIMWIEPALIGASEE